MKIIKLLPALMAFLCIGATAGLNGLNVDTDNNSYSVELEQRASLPPFTPFDLAASDTGYVIQGTIFSAAGESPAAMAIDTPNNRIAFIFGPVGTFITTPTDSYSFNPAGGPCLIYAGFGYDDLVSSFELITSAPGSKVKDATYNGYTKDSFSCNQNITFALRQEKFGSHPKTPVITEMFAALPSVSGSVCRQGQAYFIADKDTLDTECDRDSYFVFPASCNSPLPLCPLAYPCGNPCAIDCCPCN